MLQNRSVRRSALGRESVFISFYAQATTSPTFRFRVSEDWSKRLKSTSTGTSSVGGRSILGFGDAPHLQKTYKTYVLPTYVPTNWPKDCPNIRDCPPTTTVNDTNTAPRYTQNNTMKNDYFFKYIYVQMQRRRKRWNYCSTTHTGYLEPKKIRKGVRFLMGSKAAVACETYNNWNTTPQNPDPATYSYSWYSSDNIEGLDSWGFKTIEVLLNISLMSKTMFFFLSHT